MYGNYKKYRGKKVYRKKTRMSATRKAYLAGLRRGKAFARRRRF